MCSHLRGRNSSALGPGEDVDLESYDTNTELFLVKIWQEETVDNSEEVKWRGWIKPFLGGEVSYLEGLDGLKTFILSYFKKIQGKIAKEKKD